MNAECRLAAFIDGTHGRALSATIHTPNHPWWDIPNVCLSIYTVLSIAANS